MDRHLETEGYPAYDRIQTALLNEIDPAEAETARGAVSRKIRALLLSCGLIVFARALLAAIPGLQSSPSALALIELLAPLLSLILVAIAGIPYAGRVLLTVDMLMPSRSMGFLGLALLLELNVNEAMAPAGMIALRFALGYSIGRVIDYGALVTGGGAGRQIRRLILVALALAWAAVLLFYVPPDTTDPRLAAPLGLFAWALAAGPWCEKRTARLPKSDVLLVTRLGIQRWRHSAWGRLLAALIVAATALGILNGLSLRDQLDLESKDTAVRWTSSGRDGQLAVEMVAYHQRAGRLFRGSDFGRPALRIYVLADREHPKILDAIAKAGTIEPKTLAPDLWRELEPLFEEQRVTTHAQLLDRLRQGGRESAAKKTIVVAETAYRPQRDAKLSPQDPLSKVKRSVRVEPLHALPLEHVQLTLRHLSVRQVGAAVFAAFAFVIVWRRGGDLRSARWIGLWLAGIAAFASQPFFEADIRASLQLIDRVAAYPAFVGFAAVVWLGSVGAVVVVALGAAFLAVLGLPLVKGIDALGPQVSDAASVRTQGARPNSRRMREALAAWWAQLWRPPTLLVWTFLAYSLVAVAISPNPDLPWLEMTWIAAVTVFVLSVPLWSRAKRPEQRTIDPRFKAGALAATCVVAGQAFLMITYLLPDLRSGRAVLPTNSTANIALACACIFVFAIAAFWLVVRKEFLAASAGKDLSYVLTAVALSVLFEQVNGSIGALLRDSGTFTERGGQFAGILVVILLVQPLQKRLEAKLVALSNPKVKKAVTSVERLLTECVGCTDTATLTDRVDACFRELGVDRYAILARVGQQRFEVRVNTLESLGTGVDVSQPLLRRLSNRVRFVDLTYAKSEWDYFFDQFELARIQARTSARFLVPILLGGQVWGLLLLADSKAARAIATDAFAASANHVGIASTPLALARKAERDDQPAG